MERNKENFKSVALFVLVLVLMVIMLFTASCSTERKIEKSDTVYVTNTVYQNSIKYDSIFVDVYHDRFIKGDTMYVRVDSIVYRYKIMHDTMRVIDTCYLKSTDTQIKVVEKKKYVFFYA